MEKITTMKMETTDKIKWKKLAKELGIVEVGATEVEVFKEFVKKVSTMMVEK